MKNARMIPKLKFSFLIILLSFFLLVTVHSTESTQSLPDLDDPSIVSSSEPEPDSAIENKDWILNPASTKLLLVEFKGAAEEIFFEFRSEGAESSTFKVSTIVNGKTVDTQIKQFPQEEVLSANLDYQAKEGLVIGDNGFSISYPLQEDFYEVTVAQESVDLNKQIHFITQKGEPNTTTILSTVGGSCGLVIALVTFGIVWKRRKSSTREDLSIKCTDSAVLGQQLNRENLYSATPIKDSISQTPDFEVGAKLALDCKSKKESSNSQASTLATMTRLESQESNKSFLIDNADFGTITEVEDDQKQSPYVSFPDKQNAQNKLLIMANNKTILKSQESVVTKKNEQLPPKRKSKSTLDLDIALDMDLEVDVGERRMPTLAEIKALVRKMEEEGTIGQDCDPSEDTDEEDQYEAPALPNYFCCMLCFEGRRCTIVEPCRHVFACHDCVKELLDTYKICALCARPITSYEPL